MRTISVVLEKEYHVLNGRLGLRSCFLGLGYSVLIPMIMLMSLFFSNVVSAKTWHEIKTKNFIIYTDGSKKKGLKFLNELEAFRYYLFKMSNVSHDSIAVPLTIYLIRRPNDFHRLTNKKNAAGVYVSHIEGPQAIVLAKSSKWKYSMDPQDIVFHEYVHFFMAQFNRARLPRWYNEGYAEFLSSFHEKDGRYVLGSPPLARLPTLMTSQKWDKAEDIFKGPNRRSTRISRLRQGDLFYGQSWLLTHTLLMEPDFTSKARKFVYELSMGTNSVAAFEKTYGQPLSVLDDKIKEIKKRRSVKSLKITLTGFEMLKADVAKLSKADGLAIKLQAAYHFNKSKKSRAWTTEQLEKAIAKYPGHIKLFELYIFQVMSRENNDGVDSFFNKLSPVQQELPEMKNVKLIAEMYLAILSHRRGNTSIYHLKKMRSMAKPLMQLLKKDRMSVMLRYLVSYGLSYGPQKNLKSSTKLLMDTFNIYPQSQEVNNLFVDVLLRQNKMQSACGVIMPTYLTSKSRTWQTAIERQFSVDKDKDFNCSDYTDEVMMP